MPEHDNWDDHWDRFAKAASENPAQRMRHSLIARLFCLAPAGSRLRILDIGSGQGDLVAKLYRVLPAAEFVGFEMSDSGVAISKKKTPEAKFFVADLFQPPDSLNAFKDWATDAICSEVLEHVDSPTEFLRMIRPYLGENARLIVTVPGGPMSAFDRHIGHRQHFTRASITAPLQQSGFDVERVYLSGFPFFNLYRCVVIARGEKLATDVDDQQIGFTSKLAGLVMKVFRVLFRLNLSNTPFGWQVVAVVRKSSQKDSG